MGNAVFGATIGVLMFVAGLTPYQMLAALVAAAAVVAIASSRLLRLDQLNHNEVLRWDAGPGQRSMLGYVGIGFNAVLYLLVLSVAIRGYVEINADPSWRSFVGELWFGIMSVFCAYWPGAIAIIGIPALLSRRVAGVRIALGCNLAVMCWAAAPLGLYRVGLELPSAIPLGVLVQALLVTTLAGVGVFILASRPTRIYFGYGSAA